MTYARTAEQKARHAEWHRENRRKNGDHVRSLERARNHKRTACARRWRWELRERSPFRYRAFCFRRHNPNITARDLAGLYRSQRGRCTLSGRRLMKEDMQLDHIVAVARGGSHDLSNLRWVCKAANEAKSALSDAEFLALCQDITTTLTGRGATPWM